MKNLILNPNLLYLVNTETVHYSGAFECPRIQKYPNRKNVAVLEVSNHFFELERIKGHGMLLGKELPIRESSKEYIATFQKFPYEKNFDFAHANLDSLRSAYRRYQIMELGDISIFGIQKLYQGTISIKDSSSFKKFVISEFGSSFPKIGNYLLQLDGKRVMVLEDFLEGKQMNSAFSLCSTRNQQLEFELHREIPLKELKKISTSYFKERKVLKY